MYGLTGIEKRSEKRFAFLSVIPLLCCGNNFGITFHPEAFPIRDSYQIHYFAENGFYLFIEAVFPPIRPHVRSGPFRSHRLRRRAPA